MGHLLSLNYLLISYYFPTALKYVHYLLSSCIYLGLSLLLHWFIYYTKGGKPFNFKKWFSLISASNS